MRLIDADETIEQMKKVNMLFSPKIVIDSMPSIDVNKIKADAIDELVKACEDFEENDVVFSPMSLMFLRNIAGKLKEN